MHEWERIMKLKYKKMVIGITMGTMCIGFVTFSLLTPTTSKSANANDKSKVEQEASTNNAILSSAEPSLEPSKNVSDGVMELKEDAYPEIKELVEKYYKATAECNVDELGKLVTDITHIDEQNLRNKDEIIEGYENIQCYTVDGPDEGSYRVYACIDVKIQDINTPAPGVYGLYVTTTPEGELRVCNTVIDDQTQLFIDKADGLDTVKKLNDTINTKFQEVITKDADLKAFYDKLENATKQQDTATQTPEQSEKPATKSE